MVWHWLFKKPYEDRVQAVLLFQRSRTNVFDFMARLATFCSDEEFYLLMFPILFWGPICDAKLASDLCVCIGLGLPIGNILKNIFCIRRPSSPPVWQNHTSNEEHEFALPSTHALLASSVSIFVALYHIRHYDHVNTIAILGWGILVLFWSCSISLSRVYMGAHSFQDIVLGGIVGSIYGVLLSLALSRLHESLVQGSSTVVIISCLFSIIIIHSHPINKSTRLNFYLSEGTFDYTSPLVGLTLGGIISRAWYSSTTQNCISTPNFDLILRYLIGVPISVLSYILIKKLLPYIIEPIFRLLGIRAHYIPYSEFARYVTNAIKQHSDNHTIINGEMYKEDTITTNGKGANPDLLLAWVRIYTKFFLYLALTYIVAVIVPIIHGFILEKRK